MGVYEGRATLAKAIKELLVRWQDAKAAWDDPVSEKFEQDHLQPVEADIRRTIIAMDHMARVLTSARQDCS